MSTAEIDRVRAELLSISIEQLQEASKKVSEGLVQAAAECLARNAEAIDELALYP